MILQRFWSFILMFLLSVPDSLFFFLIRALKDLQGCQESQERGAQEWVSFTQWHFYSSHSPSHWSPYYHLHFRRHSEYFTCKSSNDFFLIWYEMSSSCTHIGDLCILFKHSDTSLDYGSLFSQALVCFGSGFIQAVLPCCQEPSVKLKSKQAKATNLMGCQCKSDWAHAVDNW